MAPVTESKGESSGIFVDHLSRGSPLMRRLHKPVRRECERIGVFLCIVQYVPVCPHMNEDHTRTVTPTDQTLGNTMAFCGIWKPLYSSSSDATCGSATGNNTIRCDARCHEEGGSSPRLVTGCHLWTSLSKASVYGMRDRSSCVGSRPPPVTLSTSC